jgi:hypothetical protein
MAKPIEITDPAGLQEILGYLNFSSGSSDPSFLRRLNQLWSEIEVSGVPAETAWQTAQDLLTARLAELSKTSAAFRDVEQASAVLRLLFDELLPAYEQHHRDLLFHQTRASLWRPFFIGRAAEAILSEGSPWDETSRIVGGALTRLNDYLGHRPVAVLETHKHEPYSHERVRPVPLFIAGAGVATGKYRELVEHTLAILRATDRHLLEAAYFDSDLLDELAFDPRAYDFNHPVNRRPNYHFGGWDPHLIDNKGHYRRFVTQQCTLDAVLARIDQTKDIPREQLLFEAGAVLAGTILMAAGTSGSGPEAHDSGVSLANLLPRIAAYRDQFYQQLFQKADGPHRQRLEAEAEMRRQPFAGARQHLNGQLARLRALQMQHVQLALLFARLGFSEAATRQAEIVPASSARMVCQMQCLLTTGHREADAGRLAEAAALLPQVEDLLLRAIECGAVIDPWNILGFGGQFSLFPAVENSIPDPRVDELIDLMEQIFALDGRLWHEAATADNLELQKHLPGEFRRLAEWWDHFATDALSSVSSVSGREAFEAAQRVAAALAAWRQAGNAAGTVAFWRPHADEFDSPQAYSQVIQVLLTKPDLPAAKALLMHWLSEAYAIRLDDGPRSFFGLAIRWMQSALVEAEASGNDAMIVKFFDFLEANAGDFWDVPAWDPGEFQVPRGDGLPFSDPIGNEEEQNLDPEEDDDIFSAAYESVVYRDSTGDDIDADMLEVPAPGDSSDDELEREQQRLSGRLAFLAMLAALWKMVALAVGSAKPDRETKTKEIRSLDHAAKLLPKSALADWLTDARQNKTHLLALAATISKQPIAATSAAYDALVEYDRRRLIRESILEKAIATIVATSEAELMLSATQHCSHATAEQAPANLAESAEPEPTALGAKTIALWSAALRGDLAEVRQLWGAFLAETALQPLLYVPLARGGEARKIAAARAQQQSIRELLARLPRLGMLRETCQLLRVARAMEKDHPQGAGAVTEFDRLFEIGFKSIVESLVESSLDWKPRKPKRKKAGADAATSSESANDAYLIECLQQVTESLLSEWLSHSRTLRLSVLERVNTPKAWQELVKFIERYGHDLFTQPFFHLGNLRAILHQGVDVWLDRLSEDEEAAEQFAVIRELDNVLPRSEAKKHLSLIIEAVIENYAEYRDYNATTTQSDRGELLYTLLDFLRAKVGYERIHWNLRPVMMAHEVLVRRGANGAAELWRRAMAERTGDAAEEQLKRLADLQTQYAMRLPTVADRLAERFVRPLAIDRVRALVAPAVREINSPPPRTAFALLEQEAGELAQEPCGAGLDLPDWLEGLEEEVDRVTRFSQGWTANAELLDRLPWKRLKWEEIQSQLANWDSPPEVNA